MSPLDTLLAALRRDIEEITGEAAAGRADATLFKNYMEQTLAEHHIAAYFIGAGTRELRGQDSAALAALEETIDFQLERLEAFGAEIDAEGWQARHAARARQYAGAIRESHAVGVATLPDALGFVELPAQPRDGATVCRMGCGCRWERVTVDARRGHYDYYWRLDEALENCPDCQARAELYNPFSVRFGEAA